MPALLIVEINNPRLFTEHLPVHETRIITITRDKINTNRIINNVMKERLKCYHLVVIRASFLTTHFTKGKIHILLC